MKIRKSVIELMVYMPISEMLVCSFKRWDTLGYSSNQFSYSTQNTISSLSKLLKKIDAQTERRWVRNYKYSETRYALCCPKIRVCMSTIWGVDRSRLKHFLGFKETICSSSRSMWIPAEQMCLFPRPNLANQIDTEQESYYIIFPKMKKDS